MNIATRVPGKISLTYIMQYETIAIDDNSIYKFLLLLLKYFFCKHIVCLFHMTLLL